MSSYTKHVQRTLYMFYLLFVTIALKIWTFGDKQLRAKLLVVQVHTHIAAQSIHWASIVRAMNGESNSGENSGGTSE